MHIWHPQNHLVLIKQVYFENLSFSCHPPWLKQTPNNSWYIWESISPWKFFHQLKSLRSVLGWVCFERFKSNMISLIFYKVSICCMALHFCSVFYSKNAKVYRSFFGVVNVYFFSNFYCVLPHNLSNALDI